LANEEKEGDGRSEERTMPVNIEFACRSDIGRQRSRNEDALAFDGDAGWAVLADGMGGCNSGDVASKLVVDTFRHLLQEDLPQRWDVAGVASLLQRAVAAGHEALVHEGWINPEVEGMGSTVVAAVFSTGQVVCAHVGDSRLYQLRDGRLSQLTVDHSTAQFMVDHAGLDPEVARASVLRSFLTKGLGGAISHEPDIAVHDTLAGDTYLLCSDGLTDMVEDTDIARILSRGGSTIDEKAENLVALANDNGGRDNVSVIIASFTGA